MVKKSRKAQDEEARIKSSLLNSIAQCFGDEETLTELFMLRLGLGDKPPMGRESITRYYEGINPKILGAEINPETIQQEINRGMGIINQQDPALAAALLYILLLQNQ